MREILFRAKAINREEKWSYRTNYKNGDWVYGLVIDLYDNRFPNLPAKMKNTDGVSGIDVDYQTIGQCTSLKDENGVKIFEGDIVRIIYNGNEFIRTIIWDNNELDFKATNGEEKYGSNFNYLNCCKEIEVIGNIYDNSELLK